MRNRNFEKEGAPAGCLSGKPVPESASACTEICILVINHGRKDD